MPWRPLLATGPVASVCRDPAAVGEVAEDASAVGFVQSGRRSELGRRAALPTPLSLVLEHDSLKGDVVGGADSHRLAELPFLFGEQLVAEHSGDVGGLFGSLSDVTSLFA